MVTALGTTGRLFSGSSAQAIMILPARPIFLSTIFLSLAGARRRGWCKKVQILQKPLDSASGRPLVNDNYSFPRRPLAAGRKSLLFVCSVYFVLASARLGSF